MTGKDGTGKSITLRDELSGVPLERMGAEAKRLLDGPETPSAVSYLWGWFCELSNARRVGMSGPDAIGFDQILHWQQLHGVALHRWEIECIEALDVKWREIHNQYADQRKNDR